MDTDSPLYHGHLVRRGHQVVGKVMTDEIRKVLTPP
jgi:hypothetical protein